MNLYPIITTAHTAECRDFYVRAFDARVLFEAEWYVHLAVENWEIGFLQPNAPQRLPVFQHARPSSGLCVAVEVADVRAIHQRLNQRGIETLGKPHEFANGEIAFSVMDPAGVVLNFVEHHAPASTVIEL